MSQRHGVFVFGLLLALAGGVGLALWMHTPRTVTLPAAGEPSADAPSPASRPYPAPPVRAGAPPGQQVPPGVGAAQWAALSVELASQPDELARIARHLEFADQVARFRSEAGLGGAQRLALARSIDQGLDERLAQRELSASEARVLKAAVLAVLLPDGASREAALAQWQQSLPAPAVAPELQARDAGFQRQQAAIVAAWQAQPPSARDAQALERQLDALRRATYDAPR